MRQLRIKGLVREADAIRRACSAPMTAGERDALSRRLQASVSQIDDLLRRSGASPRQLPGPSRRAYLFLKQLDLSKIPPPDPVSPQAGGQRRLPGSVRFTGLRAYLDGLLDDVARQVAAGRLDILTVLRVVQQTAQRLDHCVDRDRLAPGHLKSESLELLAWFRYFADQPRLQCYVEAVATAQRVLAALAPGTTRWRSPLLVRFRPCRHLFRWRVGADGTRFTFQTPMLTMDEDAWRRFGRHMLGDKTARQAATDVMLSEGCQEVRLELELAASPAEQSRGMVFDLAEVFDRVNQRYFQGRMSRPRLTWTRTLAGRCFGHYDFVRDAVCISSTLDRHDVPPFVIDHVMHHELLHKKHGFRWQSSRRQSHTPEFRADERIFDHYDQADQFLNEKGDILLFRRLSPSPPRIET